MSNAPAFATPGIGHNLTDEQQALRDNLLEKYGYIEQRTKELVKMADGLPAEANADNEKQLSDFLKATKLHLKTIDTTRLSEGEEARRKQAVVNGLFKSVFAEPLEKVRDQANRILQDWLEKKAEAERKYREEQARKEAERREAERVEAERRAQAAREEAERVRIENERKQREHEAEMERKRLAIAEAEKKREEERRAMEARQEEERRKREAAIAAAEEDKRKLAALERQRKEAEERQQREAARLAREQEEQRQREAREAERLAKQQEREREDAAREARKQERRVTSAENELGRAETKETTAVAKVEAVENMSAADLSRTRGDYGSVSTLVTHWTFANLDRSKLALEPLRQHIPTDALEQAVRSFIKAGGHELDGVDIIEDTRLQSR
jgi:hypothetical protein